MTTPLRPLLVVLGSCLATAALAQSPLNRSPADMIKQADTDGDGRVSRDEFIKSRTARLEEVFARLDADGSGALDLQEVEAAGDQFRSLNPEGRGGFRRPEGPRPQRPDGPRPPRPEGGRPGAGAMGAEAFDRLDGDGDGRLTREEFEAGMARMREFMQQRNGPNGVGGLGRPAPAGRGPEDGFRRPPQQE